MDCVRAGVRRTIEGFPNKWTAEAVNQDPRPLTESERYPGIPTLDELPKFLFDECSDPRARRLAFHEAGHAAVAVSLGMDVSITIKPTEDMDHGASKQVAFCNASGMADVSDKTALAAAGLVTDILISGCNAYWPGALYDFVLIARQNRREDMGLLRHAAGTVLQKVGFDVPGSLRMSVSPEDLIEARNTIPDFAIDVAASVFPAALAIGRLVEECWENGETVIEQDRIVAAYHQAMESTNQQVAAEPEMKSF